MRWYNSAAAVLVLTIILPAAANADTQEFSARFSGFQEVPPILSEATATLKLSLDKDAKSIAYELSYTSGFSSDILFAHIHFGKKHVNGGVIVFLCGGGGKPACPAAPAKVTGSITAANIIGPTTQNIPVGDFDGLTDALQSNTAYANIHTKNFPNGEIRGQIRAKEDDDNHK